MTRRRYARTPKLYNLFHVAPRCGVWRTRVPLPALARQVESYRKRFGCVPEVEEIR